MDVEFIVPVLDDFAGLRDLLATLPVGKVLVVDDGSRDPAAMAQVAADAGAGIVRHEKNRGPAAARNTGVRNTSAAFVAFIDADCTAGTAWSAELAHHFDDPLVAAVAPRVRPEIGQGSILERYDVTSSSLDMGRESALVRPGARVGFVPSAALVVRRASLDGDPFDEDLRLGEDVDLVWRLVDAGWHVRYDPTVCVRHRSRTHWGPWLRRRMEYGTSAPDLSWRHPGALVPLRISVWSLGTIACAARGRPGIALALQCAPFLLLNHAFRALPQGRGLAVKVAAQGLVADSVALGQALRREWWPLGAVVMLASPWSRSARAASALMLVPLALEWLDRRPPLDPVRFIGLRVVADAAYGTGVILFSLRAAEVDTLLPRVDLGWSSLKAAVGSRIRRRRGSG